MKKFILCMIIACIGISPGTAIGAAKIDKKAANDDTPFYGPDLCPGNGSGSSGTTIGSGSDLVKFLQALAKQESGGDAQQPGSAGGARGKYQYIDSTWAASARAYYSPASRYSQANLAPEPVQDAVAYIEYAIKFKRLNNDLFKLAISHFYPAANSNPALLDIVPPSNVITPRQYANKLIQGVRNGSGSEIPITPQDAPQFQTFADRAGITLPSEAPATGPASAANPTDPAAPAQESRFVTIIGDSILEGARDAGGLKQALDAKEWGSTIDASQNRSITGVGVTGNRLSGNQAITDKETDIKKSRAVIIELGTNPSGSEAAFKTQVEGIITKIRNYNPDIIIYWVNIFSNTPQKDAYNRILEEVSADKRVEIIDASGANITLGGDGIHPTLGGYRDFAKLLVGGLVFGQGAAAQNDTDACGQTNNASGAGAGNTTDISGTRAELNNRLLNNPKLKLGNFGSAASQKTDIENGEISDDLVKLMIAIMEQGKFTLKINSLKTDHGIDGINGHNPGGVGLDIGYYASDRTGQSLYRWLFRNFKDLNIRQMIFNLPPDNLPCIGQNGANTGSGPVSCQAFYSADLAGHDNHIHVGVFRR